MSMPEPVTLATKLAEITEYWRAQDVEPGEFISVPRGVEHRPVALEETALLLFEPFGVLNTGNVTHPTLTAPTDVRG